MHQGGEVSHTSGMKITDTYGNQCADSENVIQFYL